MPQTNSLDFSTPAGADKALKKIAQLMGRAGQSVVSSEFSQKPKRTANITYREAYLTLASGQQVTLRVTATGDIYQVLLNSSVVPLKEHTDTDKAVSEIAGLAEKNQAAFQKAQARKAVALPKGMSTPKPKMADALVAQVSQLDSQISERKATVASLLSELGESAMTDSVDSGAVLDAGALDTLRALAEVGALEDGDVPSKAGRDTLFDLGYIDRDDGANMINPKGRKALAMLDSVKSPTAVGSPDQPSTELPLSSAYVAARELVDAQGVLLDDASNEGAIAYLRMGLDVVMTNGPISLEEGNIEQARLQMSMAQSFEAALSMLDSASQAMNDAALAQLVAIAKADAMDEDGIQDQAALAALLKQGLAEAAEGLYYVTDAGRACLNDNGMDAFGDPLGD